MLSYKYRKSIGHFYLNMLIENKKVKQHIKRKSDT